MTDNNEAGSPDQWLPVLLLLFVGSGSAALIYEIVWFQMLELFVGSSSVSIGTLLGTFMGGMCLGSFLLPRYISSRHHPLRVYALLEIAIGVIGLLLLLVLPLVGRVYVAWGGYGVSGYLLRGVAASICLLPPTLAMGATLPAVARWVRTTPTGVSWLGFFYAGNIAGAREALQRIVDLFPQSAVAETAKNRMVHLPLELRARKESQVVKLGTYEQNIGLKGRPPLSG